MRLQRNTAYKLNGKTQYKTVITIPPKAISALGWQSIEDLGYVVTSAGLLLYPVFLAQRKRDIRNRAPEISEEEYAIILKKQDYRCAICNTQIQGRACVDHDHKTMKIRGLLCNTCNSGIGMLKDDPAMMFRATQYLRSK